MTVEPTPSQTVGPFFSFGLCVGRDADLVAPDAVDAIRLEGGVFDGADAPVPDAMVEIWQADGDGVYRTDFGWGRCGTDADGRYAFATIKPGRVPDDESGLQAPHVTMLVFARGLLKPVHTRVYFADEVNANAEDRVLAAVDPELRPTLLAGAKGQAYEFDVHLQGERQTVFFAV